MNHEEELNFAELFGKFVRQGRMEQKINQKDLANQLGMDQSYLCRLERGNRNVDLELAIKICSFLKLDLNEFIKASRNLE